MGISEIQKTTPKTSDTIKNVPRDCVSVVITMELPDFLIFLQTSSVPIISPTPHSRICRMLLYQTASSSASFIKARAWGPKTIPVISQPKIEGSLSFATSLPAKNAIKTAAISRRTIPITPVLSFPQFRTA